MPGLRAILSVASLPAMAALLSLGVWIGSPEASAGSLKLKSPNDRIGVSRYKPAPRIGTARRPSTQLVPNKRLNQGGFRRGEFVDHRLVIKRQHEIDNEHPREVVPTLTRRGFNSGQH